MNVNSRLLGIIDLTDVEILSQHRGLDSSPYPLAPPGNSSRFADYEDWERYARTVPDRMISGDLVPFKKWIDAALGQPDITISCCMSHSSKSIRLLGIRTGHTGYVAWSYGNDAALKVYEVGALDLGDAIASLAPLTKPGIQSTVLFRSGMARPADEGEGEESSANEIVARGQTPVRQPPLIPPNEITGYGILQTNWQPVTSWSFVRGRPYIKWYSTTSGDYLIAADRAAAHPVTRQQLLRRINQSIATDAGEIRRRQGRETA